MKRIFKQLLLIIAILLYCTNCAFAATYPCDGQVLKNAVNVRKKASQGSDQVGKLKRDEVVTVIGEETNGNTVWYKIEFGKGKTGYVRGDLIELRTSIATSPTSTSIPTPRPTHTPYVDNSMGEGVSNSLQGVDVRIFEKNQQYFSKNAERWEALYQSEGESGDIYLLVIETNIKDDGTTSPSIYVSYKSAVLGLSDVVELSFTIDDYTCTYSDAMAAVERKTSFGNATSMYIRHPSVINLLQKLQTAERRININWRAEIDGKEELFNKTYTSNDNTFIALKEIAQLLDEAGVYKNAYYDDIWLQTVTVQENGKIVSENNGSVFNKPSTWVDMPDQDAINAANIIKICYNYFTDPRGYGSVVKSTSGKLTYYMLEIKAGNAFGGIVSQTILAAYDTSNNYFIYDADAVKVIVDKGMNISTGDFIGQFPTFGFVEIPFESIEEQITGGHKSTSNSQTTSKKPTTNATATPSLTPIPTPTLTPTPIPTSTPTPTPIPTPVITVDEEILFRDIPWGTSLTEFSAVNGMNGGYVTDIGAPHSWEMKDGSYIKHVFDAGWRYIINSDIPVAGVPVYEIEATFAHHTDGANIYRGKNENALYFVMYKFNPLDKKTAFSLLKDKLNTLYGEGIDESFVKDEWNYTNIMTWYGTNETAVRLYYNYSGRTDGSVVVEQLEVQYGKTNSAEMLTNVQEALLREEANRISSDKSTDGL